MFKGIKWLCIVLDGDGVFDCGRHGWFRHKNLTMYYPVGGAFGLLTTVVDGIVDDLMEENPDITVKAIYAGNYNDVVHQSTGRLEERSAGPAVGDVLHRHL